MNYFLFTLPPKNIAAIARAIQRKRKNNPAPSEFEDESTTRWLTAKRPSIPEEIPTTSNGFFIALLSGAVPSRKDEFVGQQANPKNDCGPRDRLCRGKMVFNVLAQTSFLDHRSCARDAEKRNRPDDESSKEQ